MGAKVGGASGGKMDEINVTPLIDVVLVLLIIFMVLTPIKIQNMASNLPPVDSPEPPPDQKPEDQLLVAVYGDGTISLNLKEGPDDVLMSELKQRLRAKESKTVFVDAAPDANYGRVVTVMDMVREQGAAKVGFAEMKEEGPVRLPPGTAVPAPGAPPGVPPAPQ